jgi:hypothetical protein
MTVNHIYKRAILKLVSVVSLLLMLPVISRAQTEIPDQPKMIRVTVDHATSYVLIQWEASKDHEVDLYKMYKKNDKDSWNPIFTFGSETFEYYHMTSGLEDLEYAIQAVDTMDGKGLRQSLLGDRGSRVVDLTLEFDPCTRSNIINWTGYVGWEGNTSGYRIYGGLKGDEMEMLTFVHPNTSTWTHQGITPDTSYHYYIEAVHTSGITSLSPIEEIRAAFPEAPELLRIDEVSVIDNNSIEVRFTADVEGLVNNFRILRRSDMDSPFSVVGTIWNSSHSNMDFLDHVFAQNNRYEYLVQSIYQPESCAQPITLSQSNVGTSILLVSNLEGQVAHLTWTPYESYSTGLSGYIIQRKTGNGEFIDVASVGAETTSWQESVESVINGYQPGEVQYKVLALSFQVEGTDTGISVSNIVSVFMETTMLVPNAFTPGRTTNYLFNPVIDFAPSKYKMIIYDRGGRKLFETDDPSQGWDGTYGGGGYAMEGVYVYFIQYTDYTGLSRSVSGNVTVIYPPGN